MKALLATSLALFLSWVGPALGTELVVNGSFETPLISGAPGNGCIVGAANQWAYCPSDKVDGWTVEWMNPPLGLGNLEFHNSAVNLGGPYLGSQYVEMDSHGHSGTPNANVKIYQNLATCSGDYNISYAWKPRPSVAATSMKLNVYWGGSLIATHQGSGLPWEEVNVTKPATLGTTTLEFEEVGTGDQLGTFLDAVSVEGADRRLPNACTTINIKPGSDPNSINTCSGGTTPVIIWGSENFDVYMIDPDMLTLASAQVRTVGKSGRLLCSIADVGSPDPTFFDNLNPAPDGWPDLTCHFVTYDLGLDDSSLQAELRMTVCDNGYNNGCAAGGTLLLATDAVNIVKDCN